MSEEASFQILLLGLEDQAMQLVESACKGAEFTRVGTAEEFEKSFEAWEDGMFNAIICGPAIQGMSSLEAAQVLLNQCPETLKFYLTQTTEGYEPKNLLKNGFTMTFAMAVDVPLFKKAMQEKVLSGVKKQRSFRSVKIFDLDGGENLDFETFVYLPLNKKYIRFTRANQAIEEVKLQKLQTKQMSQVYVDHRDMTKFYQYSAKRLRQLGVDGASSTEKQEKLQSSVRSLFTDIFDTSIKADFDQGREMIKECEGIISNYITKGATSNWYQKLLSTIGESNDAYSHASNVSTFAALLAIGIGHKHPEDLAMAGLFHDLGMVELPMELQNKLESDLTDAEKPTYFSHVEKSINLVKNKRIIMSPGVEQAILQHHEKWSGKGWPKQLPNHRISEEAQILSFADQFDYLTRDEEGKERLTPLQALDAIRANGSINPDLIRRFRRLLDNDTAADKSA